MISVNEAWNLLKERVIPLEMETVDLAKTGGRILGQALSADRDYPPFHRVAMDGYALSLAAWQKGQRSFRVQGMQTAGQVPAVLRNADGCIEIMTGAKLPAACDIVIRYEDSERRGEQVHFLDGLRLEPFHNVHRQGADCKKGSLFTPARMNAPTVAIAASFGEVTVKVARAARIVIIGTGDEIVPIDASPLDYQIRASNIHALKMALESQGHSVLSAQSLPDQRDRITEVIEDALLTADIVILSGGVSAGKSDFIPSVLQDCGVQRIFHKIAQRPGKPLWAGQTNSGTSVFGLPGNPVSALISLYRYVLPYLSLMQGYDKAVERPCAQLIGDRPKSHNLTFFAAVKLSFGADARVYAEAASHHGSGDFVALNGTDGFLEIPGTGEAGYDAEQTIFPFYSW